MNENKRQVEDYNRGAWDRQVDGGNQWSIPVTSQQVNAARQGDWRIILTPTIPVPANWFPHPLQGKEVLCLASGGGQQGPILAAAGALVTVLDNSPRQLEKDRMVAERDRLTIRTVLGVMADLSAFAGESFDLIVHPVSNCFAPAVRPVWQECYRVLRPGGILLSGFNNPVIYLFDYIRYEQGELIVRHKLPYADKTHLSAAEYQSVLDRGDPLEFGHTLQDQIGGQTDAGFLISGFYEDIAPGELLSNYLPQFIATRAVKPA